MCLAVPGKILSIDGVASVVNMSGVKVNVGLQLVPEAKVGDYVLLHAGFAIQVIEEDEALETAELLAEYIFPKEEQ
ncbi:MAG: HypC/HybG/HupF family hydrogenase formation chaperone [Spirochaetes bacterium]|nr:HypC/HybG/HupF family hydrogenase formation chaperone [Spirochaetota bacterium]